MTNETKPETVEAAPVSDPEFEHALLGIVREKRADGELRRWAGEALGALLEDRRDLQRQP